jgi:hypothetical protein
VCPHCGSTLSMLDMKQMQQMVAHLEEAEQPRAVDPALPITIQRVKLDTESHFAAIGSGGGESLVDAGVRLVVQWLTKER